ncbi:MAG TPA: hypothetical protein VGF94_16070 [Kofleriaceae bacterium]
MNKLVVFVVVLAATAGYADNPHPKAGDVSVSIHDGKVEINGVGDYIDAQLDAALAAVRGANIPDEARERLTRRIGELRDRLKKLKHFDATDMEAFGREMDRFGRDMSKWGEEFGQQMAHDMAQQVGQRPMHVHTHVDDDDSDSDADSASADVDDDDADADVDAARGLGDLSLRQPQRDAIARLRADSERQIEAAKQALTTAERQLRDEIDNPDTSDAEIARAIDAVSQQEAAIRKARILAWHGARRVLDDAQRRRVDAAARHGQ